ncbi:hypothetical protein AMATHDRAFT_70764 [Amanita thiersii Skay4041]|uniref:Uncharacterized protein n=1 Tax=Amanita thiersii Skay4041 TaxID=703135 RepID=A0A2A9N6Y5_9AGAR|nr:hypothetical protein AMATHDRAFT_70764 [Amanita thiersii Skay4041]
MATSRIKAPPLNLKERIAALEQRNAAPSNSGSSGSGSPSSSRLQAVASQPSGIPQLSKTGGSGSGGSGGGLRDKIAKFEKKGGVPVPRGRFGMGAPPVDSGRARKQGELYGNRIPRAVSGGGPFPPISRSGSPLPPGSLDGDGDRRRTLSMSSDSAALHLDDLSRAGSRPTTPSDFDASSEGFQSPSSTGDTSLQIPDTPMSPLVGPEPEPVPERVEPEEDVRVTETITSDLAVDVEPTAESVPTVIVTPDSVPLPDSPDTSDAHIVTEDTQIPSTVTVETVVEETVVEEPSPPDTNEDTEYTPPSPSRSSISTLVPTISAVPVISIPDEETLTPQPELPIISLSPPPSSEDITFSGSSSVPEEVVSSQQDEQIVPTEEPSPTTTVHPSSLGHSTPLESPPVVASPVESTDNDSLIETTSPIASPDLEPLHEVDVSVDVEDSFTDGTNSGNTSITETEQGDLSVTDVLNDYTASPEKNKSVDMSPASPSSAAITRSGSPPPPLMIDKPSEIPRPTSLPPPKSPSMQTQISSDMFSPLGSFGSPGEIITAQRIATVTSRGISMVVPASQRQPDYSHFPPTPEAIKTQFEPEELPKDHPLSPSSRFRDPPSTAPIQRPSTFHAVVHGRVRQPVPPSAMPSAHFLFPPETPRSKKHFSDPPVSPGVGELTQLLEEAALLERALTDGELPSEADRRELEEQKREMEAAVDQVEAQREVKSAGSPIVPESRNQRSEFIPDSPPILEENAEPLNLKSRHTFRLPLKKKSKHWKASSTHILPNNMSARPSIEVERSAGLHIPDPSFLQMDPTAKALRGEEGCPKTPEMGEKEKDASSSKSPRPRLLSGIRKLTSSGSSRSTLHMPGAYPRHSVSTSSEISSEDSVPVITPPEQSTEFAGSGSGSVYDSPRDGRDSNHGSSIAWPSVSPKKSGIARAASFAERIWNRTRTKSGASALSVNEIKDRIAAEALNEPLPTLIPTTKQTGSTISTAVPSLSSQENLARIASPLSDDPPKIGELLPSGQVFGSPTSFDAAEMLSPAMSLPNPHSGDAASITSSPNALSPSILTNPYSPQRNETERPISWISQTDTDTSSRLDPELFDAFPSVPQGMPEVRGKAASASFPMPPPLNIPMFDQTFLSGPKTAGVVSGSGTLPRRNATMSVMPMSAIPYMSSHTAAMQMGGAAGPGRSATMPRMRPSAEYRS